MHVAACQWFPLFRIWREVIPSERRPSTFYILEIFGLKSEMPSQITWWKTMKEGT